MNYPTQLFRVLKFEKSSIIKDKTLIITNLVHKEILNLVTNECTPSPYECYLKKLCINYPITRTLNSTLCFIFRSEASMNLNGQQPCKRDNILVLE